MDRAAKVLLKYHASAPDAAHWLGVKIETAETYMRTPCEAVSSSTTSKLLDQQFCKPRALILVIVRDAYKISQVSRRPLGWLKMKTLDAASGEKDSVRASRNSRHEDRHQCCSATSDARSRIWMARNGHWPTRHSEQIPTAG